MYSQHDFVNQLHIEIISNYREPEYQNEAVLNKFDQTHPRSYTKSWGISSFSGLF
ncbi:protein of unknown function [Nitrosotalea devaniterrae]|uniref:Uncharacterized protein n=1 Tax=Nitrosotalea devaniterrae TaxID=1078905 RepID=A0A128A3J5_9ARCH|nr:protein of unknown function [Candidatus Nitrosotalea devanaterra]